MQVHKTYYYNHYNQNEAQLKIILATGINRPREKNRGDSCLILGAVRHPKYLRSGMKRMYLKLVVVYELGQLGGYSKWPLARSRA